MPLTSKPFRINTQAALHDERITLQQDEVRITTPARQPLIWNTTDGTSFTTSRDTYGIRERWHLTATHEPSPPVTALAVITAEFRFHWRFSGNHNTPCVGESVIYAYPTKPSHTPQLVATVHLFQHDTDWEEPDQLTLSQALEAILPDILEEHPDATDRDLVSFSLIMLSARFHIVVTLPGWSERSRVYEVYRSANSTDLFNNFSLLLLPVLKHLRQQA